MLELFLLSFARNFLGCRCHASDATPVLSPFGYNPQACAQEWQPGRGGGGGWGGSRCIWDVGYFTEDIFRGRDVISEEFLLWG